MNRREDFQQHQSSGIIGINHATRAGSLLSRRPRNKIGVGAWEKAVKRDIFTVKIGGKNEWSVQHD